MIKESFSFSLSGFIFLFLGIVIVIGLPLTLWTDRTLDFWLTYFKGEVVNVPFWLSFLATIILNAASLILNVLSEIIRFLI